MPESVITIETVEVNEGASDYVLGGNLDSPREGYVGDSYGIVIEGWVLTISLAVEHVEILHEERPIAIAEANLPRPDIAAGFAEVEGAERSGYRASIGTLRLPVDFEIVLRARLEDGTRLPLGRLRGRRRPMPAASERQIDPLMVNTIGRSGSTLLVTLLSSHPDVIAFSPFVKDARIATYWTSVLQDLAEPSSLLAPFDPPDLESPHWWLGSGSGGELGEPEVERWLGSAAIDALADVCRARIEAFYGELAKGEERPRYFVEKYMPYQLTPDLLAEMYPGAREVILVRDFRDMLCSVIAFNRKRGYEAFGREAAGSDAEYVETTVFNSARRLLRRWRELGDAAHLVRYENLIEAPAASIASLREYLGLDPDKGVIAATFERAESDSLDEHRTTDKASASIGRWQRDLSPELAKVCAEVLDPVLTEFGYEPTPAATPAN
jgi:hypothetical protein